MMQRIQTKIKEKLDLIRSEFIKLLTSEKSEHSVALGFSIATFLNILPLFGLHVIFGLLLALLFKKINKFSMFIAFLFWNPITLFPIYFLSFKIGALFYDPLLSEKHFGITFLNQIYDFSMRYLFGNIICAVSFAVLSYLIIRLALVVNRKFVKKEFAEINADEVKPIEKEEIKEEKIEHKESKVEVNIELKRSEEDSNEHNKNNHIHHEHEHKKHDYVELEKLK